MRNVLLPLVMLFVTQLAFGQQKKVKFGSVSKEELNMEACAFDTEAGAVVLADVGQLWFDFNTQGRFDIIVERHVRIKIFNQNGYDQADVELPYYTGEQNKASIVKLKAMTIIPNGNESEEVKVEKTAIFDEKYNEYYAKKKFTFPKVNDGVIIEYKYQLITPYFHAMRIWEFQQEIPVLYTAYKAIIPEYFNCVVTLVGHSSNSMEYERSTKAEEGYISNTHDFVGRNLPAMKRERYSNNIRNFTTKARTVMRSYNVPGRFVEAVAGTYEDLNKNLMERTEFHQLDQKNNYLDEVLESIDRSDKPSIDISNIASYVKNNTVYNGYEYFFPNELNKEVISGLSANSGAINLLLTCLLKKAGYQADPVILGTRGYIKPHPFTPDFNDFDHLIAHVSLNNKTYLLDATSDIDDGSPETSVYNAEGWLLSSENSKKVKLSGMGNAKLIARAEWSVSPDKMPTSKVEIKSNHLGIHVLTDDTYYQGERYEKWLQESTDDKISGFTVLNENGFANIDFSATKEDELDEDIIYFLPDYYGIIDYEVVNREERQTPLDIPYKINVTNIISIPIQEGYVFESGPESKKFSMTDSKMSFSYLVNPADQMLNINLRFKVNETFFLPNEYQDVRAFIRELESTLNEKYIFKKAE